MQAALIACLAAFLAAQGSRAQQILIDLPQRWGRSLLWAVAALLPAFLMALLHGWAGAMLAASLVGPARAWLVAAILVLAAAALLHSAHFRIPREPTRSLGAVAIVLALRQFGAPHMLAIMASAAALAESEHAVIGGAIGTGIALLAGGFGGRARLSGGLIRKVRKATAAGFFALALLIAWLALNPSV